MVKLNVFPKAIDSYERKDPIRDLWRNVLIVALEDAEGKRRGWYKNYGLPRHTVQATREWFLEPNRDFKLVCTLAGFDHEYVRMKARKKFKNEHH
jgi:hypothetical protein|tara:strand:+ start:138 stop:422 length:285 start_codon:yes stop_codon:yes gene_type:complete